MQIDPQQLKAFLVDAELVSELQFNKTLEKAKKTNKKINDILISEGLISQEKLIRLESYILGIPFIEIEKENIAPDVLKIIPESIARHHNIVAIRKKGNNLEVAMLDPKDLHVIEFIKKQSNLKILPRLTSIKGIKHVLRQYQKTLEAEFGEIIKKETTGIRMIAEKETIQEEEKLEKVAAQISIVRTVDAILKHAALQRSSDIHIEPMEKELIIRYRVDGILYDAMILPLQIANGVVARIKVLSNLKLDEHRLPQDGRFKFEAEEHKYSVRVSILPVFNGEKTVMRLLSETVKVLTLEKIGLAGATLKRVQNNLKKPVGIFLVTGPTGSGKTTTLYAVLEILNVPEKNISTIEDPIERQTLRVNQTQVKPEIGLTFASGLRALVRQDPDIIMVGEIRDTETAKLSINAALTGHLVLSTLHTTNAAGAIARLVDMGAEPFLIASTLNIVVAQRLVRRLCETREKYTLTEIEIKDLSEYCNIDRISNILRETKLMRPAETLKDVIFYKPKSSKECTSGYKGRVGLYEALLVTETIKELIIKKATTDQIQQQAQKEGMRTMIEDGFLKAAQGITSIEEVLRVIIE